MTRVQDFITRDESVCSEIDEIYFKNQNRGCITNRFAGHEIILMDVEDDIGHDKKPVQRNVSEIKTIQQGLEFPNPPHDSRKKRNLVKYVLSALVYVFCFSASVYYIKIAYDKWQSSPVVQATSNYQVHVKNIPFPAITICWPDKLRSDYDFHKNVEDCLACENLSCKLRNGSCNYTDLATLLYAKQVCVKLMYEDTIPIERLVEGTFPDAVDGDEFDKYMEKLLPLCEADSVIFMPLYNKSYLDHVIFADRCQGDVVQQFYSGTSDRVCMTYNGLRFTDIFEDVVVTTLPLFKHNKTSDNPLWSFDNMMGFNGSFDSLPRYGFDEFYMYLYQEEKKFEKLCNRRVNNIASIMVHSPNEIPFLSESTKILIRDNGNLEVILDPKIVLSQDDLERYSPKQRGCYFSHENKLAMFKFYKKTYCDLECLVDAYVKSCGCVPMEFPRQNSSVNVCTFYCPPPDYFCECLPDCNSLRYRTTTIAETTTRMMYFNVSVRGMLKFRYDRNKYFTDVRYAVTSHAEFFAFSLGILGGFFGVSVACVWHLLYSKAERLHSLVCSSGAVNISPLHHD